MHQGTTDEIVYLYVGWNYQRSRGVGKGRLVEERETTYWVRLMNLEFEYSWHTSFPALLLLHHFFTPVDTLLSLYLSYKH